MLCALFAGIAAAVAWKHCQAYTTVSHQTVICLSRTPLGLAFWSILLFHYRRESCFLGASMSHWGTPLYIYLFIWNPLLSSLSKLCYVNMSFLISSCTALLTITYFASAAMICFYSYVVLAGGNPPPKKAKAAAWSDLEDIHLGFSWLYCIFLCWWITEYWTQKLCCRLWYFVKDWGDKIFPYPA